MSRNKPEKELDRFLCPSYDDSTWSGQRHSAMSRSVLTIHGRHVCEGREPTTAIPTTQSTEAACERIHSLVRRYHEQR